MTDRISKQTRLAFREHLVGWTLGAISDLFDAADIPRGELTTNIGGQRRSLVEEYYAGVDWSAPCDVRKVLRVYEDVLATIERNLESSFSDSLRQELTRELRKLTSLLKRDGYVYEGGRLFPIGEVDLTAVPLATDVVDRTTLLDHIRRIESSIETDPAQAVGSSKELVETVAKLVLQHYGLDPEAYDTLPRLVKQALKCLNLSTEGLHEAKKGVESIRQVLAALSQIVGGVAELRNLYGTGHGRTRSGGLQPRHARLVVGASAILSRFLLETLDVRRKSSDQPGD